MDYMQSDSVLTIRDTMCKEAIHLCKMLSGNCTISLHLFRHVTYLNWQPSLLQTFSLPFQSHPISLFVKYTLHINNMIMIQWCLIG